jgi:IS5 family transposase
VPDQSPLHRWAKLIQPTTLHRWLAPLVPLAHPLQETQGRQLRLDRTVGETTLPHHTVRTLLPDGIRMLSRVFGTAKRLRRDGLTLPPETFPAGTPQARQQLQRILSVAHQQGKEAAERLQATDGAPVQRSTTVSTRAQQGLAALGTQAAPSAHQGATRLAPYVPLIEHIIPQTTRRVLQGAQGPASEKRVSRFEPHTAIMRQGQPGKPTACGRGLWLAEVDGGLISQCAGLEGKADEKTPLPPSVDHHRQPFGPPPTLQASDLGIYSANNERYARVTGVTEVVLPKPGRKSATRIAYEPQD